MFLDAPASREDGRGRAALVVGEPFCEMLVELEAEVQQRDRSVRRGGPLPGPLIDTPGGLAHSLERGPLLRPRRQPGEEIAGAGLVEDVGPPPA